jgi:NADH-quinone oxidoreductase subunit J
MATSAVFYLVAGGAVLTALGVVLARNVVHAVLYMVANFALTAVLYLMLHAPFVAVAQVAVYAGAIMVLFLFVVMLLGRHEADLGEPLRGQRPLGLVLVALLAALLVSVVINGMPAAPPAAGGVAVPVTLPDEFGSPAAIGDALFRYHVLSFEIISVLLLVAILGAVVLAHSRSADGPDEGGSG